MRASEPELQDFKTSRLEGTDASFKTSRHRCELQSQSFKTSRLQDFKACKHGCELQDFKASKYKCELQGLKARMRASKLQDTDASFRVARLQAVCGTCLPQLSKNCDAFRGCDWNVFTTWNCLQQRWILPHVCT